MSPQSTVPVEPLSADEERELREDIANDFLIGKYNNSVVVRLLATLDAARASRPVTANRVNPDIQRAWEQGVIDGRADALRTIGKEVRLAALPVREHPADHLPDPVTRTGIPATNAWCNRCGYFPLPLEGSRALPVREDEPRGIDVGAER